MRHRGCIVALLLLCSWHAGVAAQVLVAPPVVAITEQDPFGTFIVRNQSQEPQEVTIDFRFGHPVSDTLGTMTMLYGDTIPASDRSATAWVRAFPRQFVLEPGQQQSVRILGRPDATAADGTYWTRIVTSSTPQSARADTTSTGVSTQVIFRLEQVTTLLLRKGETHTAVDIGTVSVVDDSASLGVIVPLQVGGNSPFLGRIGATLRDADGLAIAEDHEFFAMYVDMTKLILFPRAELPPGAYSVDLVLSAERDDLPASSLLPIEPLRRTIRFVLQ